MQDRLQDADTWRDVLQKKLRESEMKSKTLRDQQRALREQKVLPYYLNNFIHHNLSFRIKNEKKTPSCGAELSNY